MPNEREQPVMMTTECPFCRKHAHMTAKWGYVNSDANRSSIATTCDICGRIVVCVGTGMKQTYSGDQYSEGSAIADSLVKNNPDAKWSWYPAAVDEGSVDHLPTHIDKAVREAHRNCSHGNYMSSILMSRTSIEAAAKDKGIEKGQLFGKINDMKDQGLIREDVAAVAHSVRLFGNDMAHGDINVEVTRQDATEVLVLLAEIMNEIYGRAARLESIKGRIEERKTQAQALKDAGS